MPAEPVRQQRPRAPASRARAGHAQPIELRDARVRQVAVVAAEQLVAAVAGEHDRDVPAGDLRDVPGRDRRRVGERLVEVLDEPIENRQRRRAARRTRGDRCRSASRPARACSSSSNCGSSNPIENVFTGRDEASRHQPDDDARVDAAREEGAERHVADHVRAHRIGAGCRAVPSPLPLRYPRTRSSAATSQ